MHPLPDTFSIFFLYIILPLRPAEKRAKMVQILFDQVACADIDELSMVT